ncbi:MAG: hypothetical protein LQ340_006069 [Diploschistes diacapsis]|nr:MAG: hypothetical protein LQ340_006069 [Diploschistes diacapsis]
MSTTALTHKGAKQALSLNSENSISEEPQRITKKSHASHLDIDTDSVSSLTAGSSSDESSAPTTPSTYFPESNGRTQLDGGSAPQTPSSQRKRRASTKLISSSPSDVRRILGGRGGTQYVGKVCCGGGCCFLSAPQQQDADFNFTPVQAPTNDAFRSLGIALGPLSLETKLTNTVELPEMTMAFESLQVEITSHSTVATHPPSFVTPHPPYDVFSSKVYHARELTKSGAEKRTYHFDLDVTDYPAEGGDVDFVVGGAIGVCAPNSAEVVDDIFIALGIPSFVRDKRILLRTKNGRWPTIWGEEQPRELVTTRRELLTWCSDVQSFPPTKMILRVLAEYAEDPNEKQILLFLSSAQGQAAFCDLRTGPNITLSHLLNAFRSSRPPLPHLLSVLNTLMPRFYSLSQDPHVSCQRDGTSRRRLIEIAVTVHEAPNWRGGPRTGVGSGFLERIACRIQEAEKNNVSVESLDLRIPLFRGLMANPLAREFKSDGPMLLVGAGVGIAPFRGFVQRRLRSANCANKVWVLQGVRDSLLDELYSGEWGVEEERIKKVVQSRSGKGKYVQEEVRNQADLVWYIINAVDGRIFVCGSTKGMGEGVEKALVDVAMDKANLNRDEAVAFWEQKKAEGQYIAVSLV